MGKRVKKTVSFVMAACMLVQEGIPVLAEETSSYMVFEEPEDVVDDNALYLSEDTEYDPESTALEEDVVIVDPVADALIEDTVTDVLIEDQEAEEFLSYEALTESAIEDDFLSGTSDITVFISLLV